MDEVQPGHGPVSVFDSDSSWGQVPRAPLVGARAVLELEELPDEELQSLARGASRVLVAGRLLLGRCLLELMRRRVLFEWGYSGINHFVSRALGLDPQEGKIARQVVRALEKLPLVREAADAGALDWTHLRDLVRVTTPEDQEFWLEAARTKGTRVFRRMVARALRDEDPLGEDAEDDCRPVETRFGMTLIPEEVELQQAFMAAMREQSGQMLSAREAHMDVYRQVVEGRLRTSPAQIEKTRRMMAQILALREEQERREIESVEQALVEREAAGEAPCPPEQPDATPAEEGGYARTPPEEAEAPVKYPAVADAPDAVHEMEVPYAAAAATEMPCPGVPDAMLVSSARVPHWEHDGCCADGSCKKRRPSAGTRREVYRRDGFQCIVPDCPNLLWLNLHHLVFYCLGGLTIPPNLLTTCWRCHANIHRSHLRITGSVAEGLHFWDREGRRLGEARPEVERRAREVVAELMGTLLE